VTARSREAIWLTLAGGCVAVGASLLGIAGVFDAASRVPYSFWTSEPVLIAYTMFALAAAAIVCAIREVPIPPPIGSRDAESLTRATPAQGGEPRTLSTGLLAVQLPAEHDATTEGSQLAVVDSEEQGSRLQELAAGGPLPGPAITGHWKNARSPGSSDLMRLQDNMVSYPAYSSRPAGDRPPASLRVGIALGCGPLAPDTPSTSVLRKRFLTLLASPAVMDLIEQLTGVAGKAWRSWDERPRLSFAAVLTTEDESETPAAWARLLLPQAETSSFGRGNKHAYLILHIEPGGGMPSNVSPATLRAWSRRFTQALLVPAAMASFLSSLSLPIPGEPPAEVAVWLTPHGTTLVELVDTAGFTVIPGSQRSWFTGLALADRQGRRPSSVAQAWIGEMCDSMNLDGYEEIMESLNTDA
jgi:hypothetical protein